MVSASAERAASCSSIAAGSPLDASLSAGMASSSSFRRERASSVSAASYSSDSDSLSSVPAAAVASASSCVISSRRLCAAASSSRCSCAMVSRSLLHPRALRFRLENGGLVLLMPGACVVQSGQFLYEARHLRLRLCQP